MVANNEKTDLPAESSVHIFLGRQPILNLQGDTVAYELLFRSGDVNSAYVIDNHMATVQVIAQAFSELGVQSVLGDKLGFINLDTTCLSCDVVEVLPPGLIVLELLETTRFTPEVMECCKRLHGKGYRLALDDIVALEPEHREILPYVSYIKVDLLGMPDDSLRKLAAQLKPLGVKLLAEKVETREQADFCASLGFEYFQGYFFARPQILTGKKVDPSHQQLLRLSQLLLGDCENRDLENVFKRDPKLTYNLIRLVNSVAIGARARIESIGQAIIMLGRNQLQRWLYLLLYVQSNGGRFPNPLANLAACRGRLMEEVARATGHDAAAREQAYMVGMMSLLEAVLEIPMPQIVEELNLAPTIRDALLHRVGFLGQALELVEAVEGCRLDRVEAALAGLSLSLDRLTAAEIAAMKWANAIGREAEPSS